MILLQGVSVASGGFVLRDVDLEVPAAAYGVLMGRTGSGKSTLLEAICGLRPLQAGVIRLDDRDVTALPPAARNIGYVPQDRALFTHLTVGRQIALPLEVRHWRRSAIDERIAEVAALLEIGPLLDRRPAGLSGGEAQRVAVARALACRPPVLLLDEPLTGLDEAARDAACAALAAVQERTGVTVLHVTHDSRESRRLADVALVLDGGLVTRAEAAVSAGAAT